VLIGSAVFLAGCGSTTEPSCEETGSCPEPPETPTCAAPAAQGTAATFDMATWNVEWFGDASSGPPNDLLQWVCVRSVMAAADLDLWSVQEIVDEADFEALLDSLSGYDGLLANDPQVQSGPQYYNDFGGAEQKVGLIWKSSVLSVTTARIVLTGQDYEFAGRPPLEVQATLSLEGTTRDIIVLALHAKAGADLEDFTRRQDAAIALKSYLEANWADADVWVLGDFNDDVDSSIRPGAPSPYDDFVQAASQWRFVTDVLTSGGGTSTVFGNDVIDHILVSNEAEARYVDGSAAVFRLDNTISDYGNTTSDHYPVLARFRSGN
jgi:endonuclease/exonuclease/phosphatase family metal-dependent hydrolase